MASFGQSITVCYRALNRSTNQGQTADAGNHTLRLVKDGASAAPTNAPAEVDSTNAKGIYSLVLTAAEAQHNVVYVCGVSSTANVTIEPELVTFENLPTASPGASGGLMRLGANVGNTTFIGSSLGNPGMSIDGIQLTNTNWGAYPLFFNDTQGSGAVGLNAAGSAAVFTFTAAGGHIFAMTPGNNKDVFHANLSGSGLICNVPVPTTGTVPGYVGINHNTGGTDAMTVKSGGNPVVGATILVFLKSDYAANPTAAVAKGATTTDSQGHWLEPVFVAPGNTYAVVVSAIGEQTQEVDVTV